MRQLKHRNYGGNCDVGGQHPPGATFVASRLAPVIIQNFVSLCDMLTAGRSHFSTTGRFPSRSSLFSLPKSPPTWQFCHCVINVQFQRHGGGSGSCGLGGITGGTGPV